MGKNLLGIDDLVNNPSARVPVCLCLDTSASMYGRPIEELTAGVKLFYDTIRNDEIALYSAEICIVTFGYRAECIQDFTSIEYQTEIPPLIPRGNTLMGEAVNIALDLLEKRKKEYRNLGIEYYQPWLILMTDGAPTGEPSELKRAINRTKIAATQKKLTVFPVGVGCNADMETLKEFSVPGRPPLRLQGLKFQAFFQWLSQSVSQTSQSMPGEKVTLGDISGWAEL